jgi:hypothetical protein
MPQAATKIHKYSIDVWVTQIAFVRNNIAFITLSFGLLWCASGSRKPQIPYVYVVMGILMVDLWTFGRHALITVPLPIANTWTKHTQETTSTLPIDRNQQRIFVDQDVYQNPYAPERPTISMSSETAWQAHIGRSNLNMLSGIASMDGYASSVLSRYVDAVAPETTDPTGVRLTSVDEQKLSDLGVMYIITKPTHRVFAPYVLQYQTIDRSLYKTTSPSLRVSTVGSSNSQDIIFYRYDPDKIEFTISNPKRGYILFRDTFYPGWTATINGVTTTIEPYNDVFKSIWAEVGDHDITFTYSPWSFKVGVAISVMTLLYLTTISIRDLQENRNGKAYSGVKTG